MSLGFIGNGLIEDVNFFFITAAIFGFGGGLMMANISIWMLQVAHHTKRIKSSGYLTSSLFFGQFFSPILLHPIVSAYGVQDFFTIVGVSLVLIVIAVSAWRSVIKLNRTRI
jgi:hypothetical protein